MIRFEVLTLSGFFGTLNKEFLPKRATNNEEEARFLVLNTKFLHKRGEYGTK